MKAPRNLADMWPDRLKEYAEKRKPEGSPEYFDRMLMNAVAALAQRVAADEQIRGIADNNTEEIVEIIKARWPEGFKTSGAIENVRVAFQIVHGERTRLWDLRAQYDWASTWDHIKTIAFRTLTTLMIAATILCTGYLAHRWGIPLPLIRGIQ